VPAAAASDHTVAEHCIFQRVVMSSTADSRKLKPRSLLGALGFLRKYPRRVAVCLGLLLMIVAIDLTLPQVIGEAINALRGAEPGTGSSLAWAYAQIFFGLALIRAGLAFVLGPIRNRTIQSTLGDIRCSIYNAMQRLPFAYHDKASTGELISRSTTDIWRLQDFFYACLFLSIDIALSLVVTAVLIFAINAWLGILTVATMVPTVALICYYATKLQPQWRTVHDLHGAMTTTIQENIAGVRVVKAFARETAEIEKFRGKKDVFVEAVLKTVNYWAARVPFAQFIFGLSLPLILWAGGRQVIAGTLQIGDLAKVIFYIMAIGHRVGAVGQFTNILQNASASAERVLEVINEPPTLKGGKQPLPKGHGAVVFDNVSFHYTDGKASLSNVTFEVRPGQTVALVGPTGSGKSTLVNLIPRFYDPVSGGVLVDGVDVREIRLDELRRAVTVMFQETFLFSASVAENIAYGKPSATLAEIERCARAAQAHEFIAELENGYETVIGERGISLSGGQRQRIAIARAFLMDPRILILDDATASVDSATERLIREAMRRLCQGRTSFIIAQRFSTVKHADMIIALSNGRLAGYGTHDELVGQKGFYYDLYHQQIGEKYLSTAADYR
jgi:ABC-type multidrug transport system fused ATPase/permease subunit